MSKLDFYHFLHVAGALVLVGATAAALAFPDPATRKRWLTVSGLGATAVLVAGFGLLAVLQAGFPWWVIAKLVLWLGLAALAGLAYRFRQRPGPLWAALWILALAAVGLGYFANPYN